MGNKLIRFSKVGTLTALSLIVRIPTITPSRSIKTHLTLALKLAKYRLLLWTARVSSKPRTHPIPLTEISRIFKEELVEILRQYLVILILKIRFCCHQMKSHRIGNKYKSLWVLKETSFLSSNSKWHHSWQQCRTPRI